MDALFLCYFCMSSLNTTPPPPPPAFFLFFSDGYLRVVVWSTAPMYINTDLFSPDIRTRSLKLGMFVIFIKVNLLASVWMTLTHCRDESWRRRRGLGDSFIFVR